MLREQFDQLLDQALSDGPSQPIDYRLDAPKWQFLCHAVDRAGYVLHGSGNPDIERFEPRQPGDMTEFGSRRAVFAATDGIWPMFFAIVDRDRVPMLMCNGCMRVGSEVRYYFSITASALAQAPWRTGMVYLLPSATFDLEPASGQFRSAQAASAMPVLPVAKLVVRPDDFPFPRDVHGHIDEELFERATADPDGFPWHEDVVDGEHGTWSSQRGGSS